MRGLSVGFIAIALSSTAANAWAEELCARAQDLTALQIAAVQQKLMVSAFTCNDTTSYNIFVLTYQKDLQESDRALQDFFTRLNADTGMSDYDAYKTRLANAYSLRSAENRKGYCALTRVAFRTALVERRKTLADFALTQPMPFVATYDACGERIAGRSWIWTEPPTSFAAAAAKNQLPVPAAQPPKQPTRPNESSSQRVGVISSDQNRDADGKAVQRRPRPNAARYWRSYNWDSNGYRNRSWRGRNFPSFFDRYWYGAWPRYDTRRR